MDDSFFNFVSLNCWEYYWEIINLIIEMVFIDGFRGCMEIFFGVLLVDDFLNLVVVGVDWMEVWFWEIREGVVIVWFIVFVDIVVSF